jgi:hypothetical protein
MKDNEVTREIIGAAIEVHRLLGPGCSNPLTRNACRENCNYET